MENRRKGGAKQAAEKPSHAVILSVAKDLALSIFKRHVPDGQGKAADLKTRSATLPRPEFLPIMGSRTAVDAQNDSAGEFFRSLYAPPFQTRGGKSLLSGTEC